MDFINALIVLLNYIIIPGATYGSQLALGALGVTLVYSILRFSNFAHGELMSLGAMFSIVIMLGLKALGISIYPLPTVLLSIPFAILLTIGFSLIMDRLVFRFYRQQKSEPVIFMIASIGVMFLINGIIRFSIGPQDRQISDGARFIWNVREFKAFTGLSEGFALKGSQGITLITVLIAVGLLFWFLNKTKAGKSMRAYSDNVDLALLSGIDPDRVVKITWIITAILATLAGALYGLDKSYKPFIYLQLLLPIFAAAIVGGIGNPVGAVLGGFVIAFSELSITYAYKRFLSHLLPSDWMPEGLVQLLSTDYKFSISFLILVLVLLIKPTGILSGKSI